MIQAIVIGQDTGLWSGNRRKMEIAECHVNIPVTVCMQTRQYLMAFG
jgi:hypothetical protein